MNKVDIITRVALIEFFSRKFRASRQIERPQFLEAEFFYALKQIRIEKIEALTDGRELEIDIQKECSKFSSKKPIQYDTLLEIIELTILEFLKNEINMTKKLK